LAGVYFGKKADSSNRIKLLSFAIIGWSVTSIVNGSVNSLAALAIGRFVLGMFTAAGEPLIFSLIGDTIPI
jgi:MFS family permease